MEYGMIHVVRPFLIVNGFMDIGQPRNNYIFNTRVLENRSAININLLGNEQEKVRRK
jgi:hypothetical protein